MIAETETADDIAQHRNEFNEDARYRRRETLFPVQSNSRNTLTAASEAL